MTHGLVNGDPKGQITLSPHETLSGMGIVALQQVKQLLLESKSRIYGPWGDVSVASQTFAQGDIVGFFGCNKDKYLTGIGVWTRNPETSSVTPLSRSG